MIIFALAVLSCIHCAIINASTIQRLVAKCESFFATPLPPFHMVSEWSRIRDEMNGVPPHTPSHVFNIVFSEHFSRIPPSRELARTVMLSIFDPKFNQHTEKLLFVPLKAFKRLFDMFQDAFVCVINGHYVTIESFEELVDKLKECFSTNRT